MKRIGIIPDGIRAWSEVTEIPLQDAYYESAGLLAEAATALMEDGHHPVLFLMGDKHWGREPEELSFTLNALQWIIHKFGAVSRDKMTMVFYPFNSPEDIKPLDLLVRCNGQRLKDWDNVLLHGPLLTLDERWPEVEVDDLVDSISEGLVVVNG